MLCALDGAGKIRYNVSTQTNRTSSYAEGVFDYYFFEKNLQGDIIAIYRTDGAKLVTYYYDAWGYCYQQLTSGLTLSTADSYIRSNNPFRYRGYYYDVDTGWYYLQSRYYNPEWRRFISADGYVSTGQGLLGYNMFAYCGNNPTMFIDPCGTCIHRWDFWRTCDECKAKIENVAKIAADVAATGYAASKAVSASVHTVIRTRNLKAAYAAGSATFSSTNNGINYIYYTYFAGEVSSLTPSSYTNCYISRWDRLTYTKQQTQEATYNLNAWRYYSEYSVHMYGWYLTGWAKDKNIPFVSKWADDFYVADISKDSWDSRGYVNIAIIIIGLLGA